VPDTAPLDVAAGAGVVVPVATGVSVPQAAARAARRAPVSTNAVPRIGRMPPRWRRLSAPAWVPST